MNEDLCPLQTQVSKSSWQPYEAVLRNLLLQCTVWKTEIYWWPAHGYTVSQWQSQNELSGVLPFKPVTCLSPEFIILFSFLWAGFSLLPTGSSKSLISPFSFYKMCLYMVWALKANAYPQFVIHCIVWMVPQTPGCNQAAVFWLLFFDSF